MKKVLIFGSEGQLGHDLIRSFGQGYGLSALSHSQADVVNARDIDKIISKENPDIVINATAYNKVEQAPEEIQIAFGVNAFGVYNLAKASREAGAVFVHVSTDYVFDGSKEFFEEDDIPGPLNVYGASKLAGEQLLKIAGGKFYIIRTSSIFGVKQAKQKLNFVDRMIALARQGQNLKVVDDQIMSPTYSLDLAGKIKELLEKPAPFGTYHITNHGTCSWYDFAAKSLELMKLNATVEPIKTESSGSKAIRPKRSVLKNSALEKTGLSAMPSWQDALLRYLKDKYE